MAANFDMVKAAAVAVLAVVCAVINIASDVSVCFHNKNLLFVLILFLPKNHVLCKRKNFVLFQNFAS